MTVGFHNPSNKEPSNEEERVGNGRRRKGIASLGVPGREDRHIHLPELDTRVELIQASIPIGLEAVNEVLQPEVCQLAGHCHLPHLRAALQSSRTGAARR